MNSNQPRTTSPERVVTVFANHSTKELLQVNGTYLREYRANPTDANLRAVVESSRELSRRGA